MVVLSSEDSITNVRGVQKDWKDPDIVDGSLTTDGIHQVSCTRRIGNTSKENEGVFV